MIKKTISAVIFAAAIGLAFTAACTDNNTDDYVPFDATTETTTEATTAAKKEYPELVNTYSGTYVATQGLTALDLSVFGTDDDGDIQALFSFHEDPANPGVPTGSYLMEGTVKESDKKDIIEVVFTGSEWEKHPETYHIIDFTAYFDVKKGTTVKIVGYDKYGTRTPLTELEAEGSLGAVFDAKYYADQYPDLEKAYGYDEEKLLDHFLATGLNEGRTASPVFSIKYYMQYKDLQEIYGADRMKYIAHFERYGMEEGRQGIETFNVRSYRLEYQDLRRAFGDDLKAYYEHFVEFGYRENRHGTGCTSLQNPITSYQGIDYSRVYDYNYYIAHNPDVVQVLGNDDLTVLKHFINYGMDEGRRGCDSFNVQSYQLEYGDLRKAYGDDLKSYYLHYIRFGYNEHRHGTGCTSLQDATTEYEDMDYSAIYDYEYYAAHNPDVIAAMGSDEDAVLMHFVKYGMEEGRRGNADFNVKSYKAKYEDLQAAYGDDWKAYYLHYIKYGLEEGRTS